MQCHCSARAAAAAANEWMQNGGVHGKYPSTTVHSSITKSRESLSSRKSNLKTPSKPDSFSSLNRQKRTRQQEQQRSSTLPRSLSNSRHKTPNVSTISSGSLANSSDLHYSNSSYYRQRRKSDVAPWHRKAADASQCTCRSSCYFCELNYPKVINNNFSTSTNALSFASHPPPPHHPTSNSSYSINNLNYVQTIPTTKNNANSSTHNLHQYQFPNNNSVTNYQHHHHSMINLNHIAAPPSQPPTEMMESNVPSPPIPPLNPSCARCRFTANSSSNPTINCSQNGTHGCGLLSQTSAIAPTVSDNVAGNCFAGEFYDWKYIRKSFLCVSDIFSNPHSTGHDKLTLHEGENIFHVG